LRVSLHLKLLITALWYNA